MVKALRTIADDLRPLFLHHEPGRRIWIQDGERQPTTCQSAQCIGAFYALPRSLETAIEKHRSPPAIQRQRSSDSRDVTTRCTSALAMIKRLLHVNDAVHTSLSNSDKRNARNHNLSAESLFQLKELNRCALRCMERADKATHVSPRSRSVAEQAADESANDVIGIHTPVVYDLKKRQRTTWQHATN